MKLKPEIKRYLDDTESEIRMSFYVEVVFAAFLMMGMMLIFFLPSIKDHETIFSLILALMLTCTFGFIEALVTLIRDYSEYRSIQKFSFLFPNIVKQD